MITAAADGSALSNPGPAGWAWYVDDDRWAAGGWPHGTNNMGELMAVLDLLRQTRDSGEALQVLCDSQYAINVCTTWIPGWKRKGWRKADGSPVLNVDLVKQLDSELSGRTVQFDWVKGHAGHSLNDKADELARAVATAYRDGQPPRLGPGFGGRRREASVVQVDLFTFDEDPGELPSRSGSWPLSQQRSADRADRSGAAAVWPQAVPEPETLVVELERALLTDEVRLDRERLADLLHPDYVGFEASGQIRTRGSLLARAAVLGGRTELTVLGVDALADHALLVRCRLRREGEEFLSSSVWVRVGDSWLLRFRQETPTG